MQNTEGILQEKKDCCGCSACEAACPVNAITMKKDEEGFYYPLTDFRKCISCGLCHKTCAFKQKDRLIRQSTIKRQYAIKYKRNEIRSRSQSGGAFAALAVSLMERYRNISVYGASLYDVYKVRHSSIHSISEIEKLQGSKYVPSNMSGVYEEVEADLRKGKTVMFAGTPCQNHAVKQYLSVKKTDCSRLYLMDFICEGVGSPYIWEEYIKLLERKFKGPATRVNFRDKRLGWIKHYESVEIDGYPRMLVGRIWTNLFYDKLFFRESCHHCRYTTQNRESDITVSWFGNVESRYPGFDDGNGVSGIMINTDKGLAWFDALKEDIEYIEVSMEDLMQKQLQNPIGVSPKREAFWNDFTKGNKWRVMGNYDTASFKNRIKRCMLNLVKTKWKWL